MEYRSIAELVALAEREGKTIGQIALAAQAEEDRVPEAELRERMREALQVMREAVKSGMQPDLRSVSGMTGGQAAKLMDAVTGGKTFGGDALGRASAFALAVAECNACMGKIVAAPTAGACGILPAALFSAEEEKGCDEAALVDALFAAAGVGRIIAEKASISGAEGGCQAECGSAAAMAAAALTQLGGGSPAQCARALAFALMNLLGLVCDPVDGLVEIPCVYRNVIGVAAAVTSANLALADARLILPADEVIDAMGRVGRMLPYELRETGRGGCAACKRCEDTD